MSEIRRFSIKIEGEGIDRAVTLSEGTTSLGRTDGNDIVLPHRFVSSRHAQLAVSARIGTITDLGSTNGTVIDETKLTPNEPVRLVDGTRIVIGPYTLTVSVTDVPAPEPEPAEPVEPEIEAGAGVPDEAAADEPAAAEEEGDSVYAATQLGGDEPPAPPRRRATGEESADYTPPPGLDIFSRRLIHYLPNIYQPQNMTAPDPNDPASFMSRFLGLFESVLLPIEWTVDNFDLFLHARTAPADFLPWLARWYGITFDATWSEAQRRTFLTEAHALFGRRGTKWSLSRVLEIYTGVAPEITETFEEDAPFSFTVRLPIRRAAVDEALIARIIDNEKPAHTTYQLLFLR